MEGFETVPTAISIAVVLAVLVVTLLILKWVTTMRLGGRGRGSGAGKAVSVIERHSMGRNGALVVIEYGGREHVLGVTESSITHLMDGTIDLREEDVVLDAEKRRALARTIENLRERTVRR